jgi:hypothetical protein
MLVEDRPPGKATELDLLIRSVIESCLEFQFDSTDGLRIPQTQVEESVAPMHAAFREDLAPLEVNLDDVPATRTNEVSPTEMPQGPVSHRPLPPQAIENIQRLCREPERESLAEVSIKVILHFHLPLVHTTLSVLSTVTVPGARGRTWRRKWRWQERSWSKEEIM